MKNENWGKEILEGLKNKVNEIKEDASRDLEIMFSDTKEVMAIWKWTKRLSLIGIGVLITSTVTVTTGEYNTMKKELTQKISNREEDLQKFHKENNKLRIENIELNKQVEIAQAYLELDDTEKEIVDIKIDEVNKATEEQLAQEKAQKEAEEAAKKQAEEEAKRKAEEEEKTRKEEEERQKAEAEKKYIDATNFIKECADASGYKFDITRNGNKIDIYYNAGGDIKVSELIKQGISKEEIISMSGYDNLRNIYKETASSFQQQVNSLYSEDIIITIAVAFNGETCYKVDGNGNVIIDLLK